MVYTGDSMYWRCLCARWSHFRGTRLYPVNSVWHSCGGFLCQSTSGCRLNFCPLKKWNSLSSQCELSSARERYDLHWIPVLFLRSLNKFEHYLTIQRDEWLFWCWGWRKSKCSGREDFQLWQCCRQNGSLIRVHTERAIFMIIYIYVSLEISCKESWVMQSLSSYLMRQTL